MKGPEQFQQYYDVTLNPILIGLELQRKALARTAWWLILTPIVLMLIAGIAGMNLGKIETNADGQATLGSIAGFLILAGFGSIVICILIYRFSLLGKIRAWKSTFKSDVVAPMVKFVDESLSYSPGNGISHDDYEKSKIFPTGVDRYNREDMVSGTIGKTAIRFSEIHSEKKHVEYRDGKQTVRWETIFKGVFFVGEFNKNFIGRTVVLPDSAESLLGSFGTMFQKMNMMRDDLIKLEDPHFEKTFAVYGTDQVEARYILSPALMQRIMDFKAKSGKVYLSFVGSHVFIATPVRENLFDPPLMGTLDNFGRIQRYHNYLALFGGVVDDLNLNNRIWTKE